MNLLVKDASLIDLEKYVFAKDSIVYDLRTYQEQFLFKAVAGTKLTLIVTFLRDNGFNLDEMAVGIAPCA